MRVVLASKSPARLGVLRGAGIQPEVIVSGFDESQVLDPNPARLSATLARAKGEIVAPLVDGDVVLIACDSVLEFEGRAHGKPGTPEAAARLWRRMRAGEGLLHTGHYVLVRRGGDETVQTRVGTTLVRFADLDDAEIDAYVATGEPTRVAGGFTIDGIGGAFVTSIEGDPYNIVGLSLPLVRQMVLDADVKWPDLWDRT
ncbi:Maf family protein [Tessaracoccus palaemonis]|uniref:Nucleoside triphosphate pyrophosphatase n=1 Tax=Tessaracoccus palaemonis TaxID=2829499 RepID=A0ABX8SK72_9ACTN|nr:nucleoside triphosphate pyrophosphatase [Tessaracoccus palaemonis]QXT63680.1 Maf family nucleotide pyrophosphatase [Tessaracoccus palaemonis]